MNISNKYSGFTIVELIVVMILIGMLAGFTLIRFPGAQKSARDNQRHSDLKQYQAVLESYANIRNGLYPSHNDETPVSVLCTELNISACTLDPRDNANDCNGTCRYFYSSNGSCNDGTPCASQYVLYSRLEREDNVNVVCSNGSSGLADPSSDFTNGNCPITIPTATPTSSAT